MKFTVFQDSRIGKRKSNQDRIGYCYSRDAMLMVVADGMGGHLYGEIAAHIAVQFITEAFQREAKPTLRDPLLFLSQSFIRAHHAIIDYAEEKRLEDVPRTTCVACIIQDNVACWAHAGDSRLYLIRQGKPLAQTRDHSRLQMLVDQGLVSEEEIPTHPARNRIFSCLGGQHSPQVDFSRKTPLQAGDYILLCSDGVWGMLDNAELIRILTTGEMSQSVARLMSRAEQAGGAHCDNLSLVALRWEDSYTEESSGAISTQNLPSDHFTTKLGNFTRSKDMETPENDLSDDEIERAIQEINSAIQKYSK